MSNLLQFFPGSTGGGAGIFPIFPPHSVNNTPNEANPEGYNSDGDHFILPASLTGSLIYRDSSEAGVYTLADQTAIHANATAWLSFTLDGVSNLLYVTVIDDINDVIYLASVNSSGTVVNIGNATTSTNLVNGTHGWTGPGGSNKRGASMERASEGSGNFEIIMANTIIVLNDTNGSIVSETTVSLLHGGCFELSTAGTFFQLESLDPIGTNNGVLHRMVILQRLSFNLNDTREFVHLAPTWLGLPYIKNTNGQHEFVCLRWKGKLFLTVAGATVSGNTKYDIAEFRNAADSFAKAIRAI